MRFIDPLHKKDISSYKNCEECKVKNTITCKFCLNKYCVDHLLPEVHDCEGLKEYKEALRVGDKDKILYFSQIKEKMNLKKRKDEDDEQEYKEKYDNPKYVSLEDQRTNKIINFIIVLVIIAGFIYAISYQWGWENIYHSLRSYFGF